jgi:phage terminase small subunit
MAKKGELTPKQQRFVDEYLVDLNATQAAIRAGYNAKTAQVQSSRLLSNVMVGAAISAAQAARSERTQVTADEVLKRLWSMATADANELVEFRRRCCRHCYGEGFGYQLTEREMDQRRSDAEVAWNARKNKKPTDIFTLDELGGTGFDARKSPNPDCPECFGDGIGASHFKDTRALSPAARQLYAGVKQTKEGIEVKLHDQLNALVNVGKHLGMFTERVEHAGDPNAPLHVTVTRRVIHPNGDSSH